MATIFSGTSEGTIVKKNGVVWRYDSLGGGWAPVKYRGDSSGFGGSPLIGAYDIRENIFSEWNNNTGTLQTYNGAGLTDTTQWATNRWNGRNIMSMATVTNVNTGPGIKITVPAGYDMVWLRRHGGDSDLEPVFQYAWNSSENYIGTVRDFGRLGMSSRLVPSSSGFTARQYRDIRHFWTMPMLLPDRNGGTIYIAHTGNDPWIGGFAFGRNDRNLTYCQAVQHYRNDFGSVDGATWNTSFNWVPSQRRSEVGTTAYTRANTIPMRVVNKTGGDKILSIVWPREGTGSDHYPKPWLSVSNLNRTIVYNLPQQVTGGVDLNPIYDGYNNQFRNEGTLMSWRVPAEAINRIAPVTTDGTLQPIRFDFIAGDVRADFRWNLNIAYLFDA